MMKVISRIVLIYCVLGSMLFWFISKYQLLQAARDNDADVSEINYIQGIHLALTGNPTEMSLMFFTDEMPQRDHFFMVIYSKNNFTTQSRQYKNFQDLEAMEGLRSIQKPAKQFQYETPEISKVVHEFILRDLPPHERIYYQIIEAKNKNPSEFNIIQKSKIYQFWTQRILFREESEKIKNINASAFLTEDQPSILYLFGDMDVTQDSERVVESLKNQIQKYEKQGQILMFHFGDIPYAWKGSEEKWDQWFDMMQPITSSLPYMVCVGNHEEAYNFTSYKSRFTNFTSSQTTKTASHSNIYYSFDYGPIHFVVFSLEQDHHFEKVQKHWIESDLAKVNRTRTPYIFAVTHRPPYSSNANHQEEFEENRQIVEGIFEKYGVDVALYGHVHAYERTCPIQSNYQCDKSRHKFYFKNPNGTIHIPVGSAGYERNREWSKPQPQWSLFRHTNLGYLKLTLYGEKSLYFEYFDVEDYPEAKKIDEFLIEKTLKTNFKSKK